MLIYSTQTPALHSKVGENVPHRTMASGTNKRPVVCCPKAYLHLQSTSLIYEWQLPYCIIASYLYHDVYSYSLRHAKATSYFGSAQEHWENKHIPLLKSLTDPLFPLKHTPRYLARTGRKGFGSLANPIHPPLNLRGSPGDFDFDDIAEMTFKNERAFEEFYKTICETGKAAKLAADKEQFLDSGKMRAVAVGETMITIT
ncbi:uncharacterized protein BDR25DRAFT_352913 [Lindgomyces ingoldianus]|uniref:Uncharacterized protein n=1 Tax=Lindgomyces ingoldianus TaxID=673940 RepID=A0ACB6R2X8_9PLEO|nr:uncharacterized protein BDR25DRAFT_352913 [Lindgomyces ingoldianus]KAF2473501.1 hypothetical protein BDR25DRAFT_352913 [Lindgomyces ingoldianus]